MHRPSAGRIALRQPLGTRSLTHTANYHRDYSDRLLAALIWFSLPVAPVDAAEFLGIPVGERLTQLEVSSIGAAAKTSLQGMADKEVIIVVKGSFIYSGRRPPGEQDAKYRFGGRYGSDKVCLPCEDKTKASVSFQIDGDYREPMKEDFPSHTYVYVWKVPSNGEITFKIADDNYTDNRGGLEVSVFRQP